MDWRLLPSLPAVRALVAFADGGSVVAAGEALGVTHAAISQQLKALEAQMGVALLDRSGRALQLTPSGQKLAYAARTGFEGMIETAAEITGARDSRPLQISTTPTFAAAWLMPRLSTFRTLHREIDLMLDPTPELVTLSAGGIDVAIRYGQGPWDGLDTETLLETQMVVIAAAALVGSQDFSDPRALAEFPWMEEYGTTESTNWLRRRGVLDVLPKGLFQVPGNLLLDGVRDGQGVAVTARAFVEADIQSGRLRCLYTEDLPGAGYHIVTRPGVMRPPLRTFVRWLRREGALAANVIRKK